jgi:hypothetical protein
MRISLLQTPQVYNAIGSYRGQSIGSLRPKVIGQLRSATVSGIFQNGLMLVPNETSGLLIGKKQQNLGVNIPPQASYDAAPIYKEHTFEFRPNGGMGESVQSSRTDRRYHYGINVWGTGGRFGLGPAAHTIVPATTGSIRGFVEALNGSGQLALFILAGANVLERTDDSVVGQVVSRTRAGHIATDAARFTGAYSGAVDALYVAWDDGVLEESAVARGVRASSPRGFLPNFPCRVGDDCGRRMAPAAYCARSPATPSWPLLVRPILVGSHRSRSPRCARPPIAR